MHFFHFYSLFTFDSPVTEFGPHVEPLVEGDTVHNHLEYNDNGSCFEGRLRHGLTQ
jgi:hypothetical protein